MSRRTNQLDALYLEKVESSRKHPSAYPIGRSTIMAEFNLAFSDSYTQENGSFKLLELPPELCQLIESASNHK